jgi:hypothetical protein
MMKGKATDRYVESTIAERQILRITCLKAKVGDGALAAIAFRYLKRRISQIEADNLAAARGQSERAVARPGCNFESPVRRPWLDRGYEPPKPFLVGNHRSGGVCGRLPRELLAHDGFMISLRVLSPIGHLVTPARISARVR